MITRNYAHCFFVHCLLSHVKLCGQVAEIPRDDVVRWLGYWIWPASGTPLGRTVHESAQVALGPCRHQIKIVAGDHKKLVGPVAEPLRAPAVCLWQGERKEPLAFCGQHYLA